MDPAGTIESPYRWIVLGVSTAVNTLAWGARSTFALFYVAMLDELAWGRGPTALGYSLSWLCFVAFAPVAGGLYDRWGARTVVPIGGLVLGLALALTGQATSLTPYYLSFGVLGAAGTACIIIPSTTIVTRWFLRSRGTAMGVLSTATPGSALFFYPVTAWLIATLGWRTALVAFGGIVAAATISVALLYRDPPRSEGPRDACDAEATRSRSPRAADQEWTLRRALVSTRLWAAFSMMALGTIGYQIMATHQVAHAVDRGLHHATVVWLFALGAGCTMAGNLLGGWLSDHFGRGWVFVVGSIVAIVGIGSLASMRGPRDLPLLVLYTAAGFGFGMRIAQLSAIPADVFAGPHLGAILGVVQARVASRRSGLTRGRVRGHIPPCSPSRKTSCSRRPSPARTRSPTGTRKICRAAPSRSPWATRSSASNTSTPSPASSRSSRWPGSTS